jgi:hypothetical protein
VIELCRDNGIPVFEKDFSLTDVYGADEAFVTGTFAGVVPAHTIDGRKLTDGRGPTVERLQQLYRAGLGGSRPGGPPVTLHIAMWSGPRNLSTAMMRSFGSRSDTFVSDEPFYGAFLKDSGVEHRCVTKSSGR